MYDSGKIINFWDYQLKNLSYRFDKKLALIWRLCENIRFWIDKLSAKPLGKENIIACTFLGFLVPQYECLRGYDVVRPRGVIVVNLFSGHRVFWRGQKLHRSYTFGGKECKKKKKNILKTPTTPPARSHPYDSFAYDIRVCQRPGRGEKQIQHARRSPRRRRPNV